MSANRPIKNATYTFRDHFRTTGGAVAASPTITSSSISIDGAALAAAGTTCTEVPAASGQLQQVFTAAEMGGDVILLQAACSAVARAIDSWKILTEEALDSGMVQTSAANTTTNIRGRAAGSSTANLYRFHEVEIVRGTNAGYKGLIVAYDGTNKDFTVAPAMAAACDNTSVYKVNSLPSWKGMQALLHEKGIVFGTCASGATVTGIPSNLTGQGTNAFLNAAILFLTGVNDNLFRRVTAYNTGTGAFTVADGYPSAPSNGDLFLVLGTVG